MSLNILIMAEYFDKTKSPGWIHSSCTQQVIQVISRFLYATARLSTEVDFEL